MNKRAKRGEFSEEEIEKALSRINYTTDLKEAAKNADFVFEAAAEDLELKRKIFAQLDEICPRTRFSQQTVLPLKVLS